MCHPDIAEKMFSMIDCYFLRAGKFSCGKVVVGFFFLCNLLVHSTQEGLERVKSPLESVERLERLERLERFERLERMERLEGLERLERLS